MKKIRDQLKQVQVEDARQQPTDKHDQKDWDQCIKPDGNKIGNTGIFFKQVQLCKGAHDKTDKNTADNRYDHAAGAERLKADAENAVDDLRIDDHDEEGQPSQASLSARLAKMLLSIMEYGIKKARKSEIRLNEKFAKPLQDGKLGNASLMVSRMVPMVPMKIIGIVVRIASCTAATYGFLAARFIFGAKTSDIHCMNFFHWFSSFSNTVLFFF